MWDISLLGILVLGVSLAVRSGKHKENPAIAGEANHPVIIHASAAYRGDMDIYSHALCTVTPISTINVFSQVSGQVLAVHYAMCAIVFMFEHKCQELP
jgi:membrane fusion protein, multidrug efflux system